MVKKEQERKRCGHCRFPLPLKEFSRNAKMADGLSTSCKVCAADVQAERIRRKNNERKSGKGVAPVSLW